jgi:hypothetical protein
MLTMEYLERFTDTEIEKIVDEGLIYMCACPAQVADSLRKVRNMYRYQLRCLRDPQNDHRVHAIIVSASVRVHAQLEDCLEAVLVAEQWDRKTLSMPPELRERQAKEISGDSQFFEPLPK